MCGESTRLYALRILREAGWTPSDAEAAAPIIASHIFWLTFAKGSRSFEQRAADMRPEEGSAHADPFSGPCASSS